VLQFFRRSLGRKILLAVGLPAVAVAFGAVAYVLSVAEREVHENSRSHLSSMADIVIAGFAGAQPGPNPHGAVLAAVAADIGAEITSLEVFNRDGVVKFARDPRRVGTLEPDAIVAGVKGSSTYLRNGVVAAVRGGTACASCHVSAPGVLGGVYLSVKEPPLATDLRDLYRTSLGAVICFILAASLAGALALRAFVRKPLQRLAAGMAQAQKGDFLFRLRVESVDEVGQLATSFNTMLAAITDLHALRLEDAHSIESMQRELRLKAQVEAQHRLIDETNRRLESRLRELTLLFDLTRSMSSTLQLDELLRLMTELVGGTLGFNEFVLLLLDDKTGELVVKSSFGVENDFDGTRYKQGEGAVGVAAQSGELLLIRDTRSDPRYLHYKGKRPADGSNLSIPMAYQGKVVGVMNFFRPVVDAFSEDEIRLLQSVANQAAMAIANARLHEQTVELSLTDALTGVYNRRHLFSRLEMELTRAGRFEHELSLVMIDVDHFKKYNDTHGHPAGDLVLKQVASILAGAVRKVDTVARYGGEEFAVLLPKEGRAGAVEVAEKLRRAVASARFPHAGTQPAGKITISVGVASYPADAAELAKLVDCADSALYAAKKAGRDNVQAFAAGMQDNPGRERSVAVTSKVDPVAR
jgi:diguanylate cyclase (GGDEF)-like protein